MELKEGTLYLIRNDTEKYRHFEGIFNEYVSVPYYGSPILAPKFINCFRYHRTHIENVDNYYDSNYSKSIERSDCNSINVFCDPIKTRYYNAEKVKNAKKALQNRERRTVNMILRRLIGDEHFEW